MDKKIILNNFKTTLRLLLKELHSWNYVSAIEDVYLYGSFPKGMATSQSDIDICIVLNKDVPPQELRAFKTKCNLLGPIELDIHFTITSDFSNISLYNNNVKKEGKQIWKKN